MNSHAPYTCEAVTGQDGLTDLRIHINGKTWHMWGRNGQVRERDMATNPPPDTLPVLLGSGLGHCLEILAAKGPVAVVDKESTLTAATGVREEYSNHPNVLWVDATDQQQAFSQLTAWQREHGNLPFAPIAIPVYLRLDRDYYSALNHALQQASTTDFWSQARYPKFQSARPRVLFFDSKYFLCDEIRSALSRLELDFVTITLDRHGRGSQEFIETLLKTVIDFKPDFILTVNHFGLDREGKLAGLLEDLRLPLASWFVDNPHLILHHYAHPGTDNTVIFSYDAGNLELMRRKGFKHAHYLPLATDPNRFRPGLEVGPSQWSNDISFVGNSMLGPVNKCLNEADLPHSLENKYQEISAQFGKSGETDVLPFLESHAPEWFAAHAAFPTPEHRLALESLITWEATRQYRLACVSATLPYAPLIVGDEGWYSQLPNQGEWRHLNGLDYYEELPRFYPTSKINFNCTSRQMPGAVNQRVFDVPACGAFLLTDYREQMEDLFDLDTEVAVYRSVEEIPPLVEKYLNAPKLRARISTAARARVLAEHTYEIRLQQLVHTMRQAT